MPQNFVDVSGLIVDPCAAVRQGNSFAVTGRGGIPPSPDEALGGEAFLVDLITMPAERTESQRVRVQTANEETGYQVGDRITEATGWIINDKGQVVLIASHPNVMGDRWWRTPPNCPVLTR
ncbi:MAG TPA: hypothetical protein DCY88_17410 [Cyanobacteria bacterium UBA11372]|nr:hypothetical protein [Cyanobacteria bacterium UBA11372]